MGLETTYKPLPSQSATDCVISGLSCHAHQHPRELHPMPFIPHETTTTKNHINSRNAKHLRVQQEAQGCQGPEKREGGA